MKPAARRALAAAAAAAALLLLAAYSALHRQTLYTTTWFDVFDTVSIVQGYARSQAEWDAQMDALHDDLVHYHQLFDIYHVYDGVTNLHDVNARAAGAPVAVEDDLYGFLRWYTAQAAPETGGAVNIAAGAVLGLWHDARESDAPAPPAQEAIREALTHCDPADLLLDDAAQTVAFADPAMTLDVGAVAKGYAVEAAAAAAEERGLQSALLNIGGNVRAIGEKANGEGAWTAGVTNPWGGDPAYIQAVELPDGCSLVISGDYQRYFTYEGQRYSHLIDLTTGWPARYCTSVAVLTPPRRGGSGDAFSTALFCLPEADGRALLDAQDGFAALWMYPDGTTAQTENWPGQPSKGATVAHGGA